MPNEATDPRALTGEARRSFWLCVGNGAIVMMGMAFYAYETVMAGLAFQLTGSTVLVGLLTSAAAVGWQWPQLIVGNWIEHRPRKMPVYLVAAIGRLVALFGMVLSVWLVASRPQALFWLIMLWTILFSSSGGICVIPFMDILAKSIPPYHRPMLFAYRRLFGGLLGFAAGLITAYVLSPRSGLAYPYNYVALLLAGTGLNALAYSLFLRTREPIEPVAAERKPFLDFLRSGVALFREDRDFRLFYAYRVFLMMGAMCQVLIVPFAIEVLDAPVASTGGFAATMALVSGVSSLAWGRITRRFGEAFSFRVATVLLALMPAAGGLLAFTAGNGDGGILPAGFSLAVCFLLFAVLAAARNGTDIAGMVYLLALPPPERRPTYMAFMNALSAPLMLLPVVAGVLAAHFSYAVAFGVSLAATVVAFGIALKLRRQG